MEGVRRCGGGGWGPGALYQLAVVRGGVAQQGLQRRGVGHVVGGQHGQGWPPLLHIREGAEQDDAPFANEKKLVNNLKKAILMVAGAAVQKLMMQLEKEQEVLMGIADIAIIVYEAESALLRVQKLIEAKGEDAAAIQIAIVKTYFYDAADKINKLAKDVLNSFAEGDELKMMLMGLKRFTKLENINPKENRQLIAQKLIADGTYSL